MLFPITKISTGIIYHITETKNVLKCHLSRHMAEKYSIAREYITSKNEINQQLKRIKKNDRQTQINVARLRDDLLSTDSTNDELVMTIYKSSSTIHRFVREKQNKTHDQLD